MKTVFKLSICLELLCIMFSCMALTCTSDTRKKGIYFFYLFVLVSFLVLTFKELRK